MLSFSVEVNLIFICIIIIVLFAIYYYLSRNFNYWSSRGIKGPKPWIILGSFYSMLFKTLCEIEEENLDKYGNVYGVYEGSTPMIVVAEPELVKNIMIKDFNLFINRRLMNFSDPILDRAVSIVTDDQWKNLRSAITPAFSAIKIKNMYKLVEHCVQALDRKLENVTKNEKELEMKKLMGDYTMDVIASCAFALKTDTHNDPNNPFVKNAKNAFNGIRLLLLAFFGPIVKIFGISLFDPKILSFFRNSMNKIIKQRQTENYSEYHDFLQIMINSKENKNENNFTLNPMEPNNLIDDNTVIKSPTILTDDDILANSFMFLLGGYETTSTLLSHLTYCLAINPECQQRLLKEILSQSDHLNEQIDYDTIVKLPYLEACVSETLRLYNPALLTTRLASQDYKLGDTGITISKGMIVYIPIHAIHHCSKYYPNSHRFDPDRFMPENRYKLVPYTYLPFGTGPRNCVGMRFALMATKAVIAILITKYRFIRTENTKIPLKMKKFSFQMNETDITIGIQLRNN